MGVSDQHGELNRYLSPLLMPIQMTVTLLKIYTPKRLKEQERRHRGLGNNGIFWRMDCWSFKRTGEAGPVSLEVGGKASYKVSRTGFTRGQYEHQLA